MERSLWLPKSFRRFGFILFLCRQEHIFQFLKRTGKCMLSVLPWPLICMFFSVQVQVQTFIDTQKLITVAMETVACCTFHQSIACSSLCSSIDHGYRFACFTLYVLSLKKSNKIGVCFYCRCLLFGRTSIAQSWFLLNRRCNKFSQSISAWTRSKTRRFGLTAVD